MKKFIDFPVLIIDDELDSDTAGGRALREIIEDLKKRDLSVIEALKGNDGRLIFLSHPNISCILIDWFLGLEVEDDFPFPEKIIKNIREKNRYVPILLITDKLAMKIIPNNVFRDINGYLWKTEDTPHFIAGRIEQAAQKYLEDAFPPFFKGLYNYVNTSKYSWHTPGHSGGVAFLKTTSGRLFFDFFGENTLRADLSVSVPELGSLLEHTDLIYNSEKFAAKIFGANKTYFVTNGTSTANKIVFHSAISSNDNIWVDRNCHKSIMHSLIMTGVEKPEYLIPTRNNYGIIGPIPLNEFSKIDRAELMVITNSTYDGLCYNVKKIVEELKNRVKIFHFDEAWYAYAKFHKLYENRFGMSIDIENINKKNKVNRPVIFSTHSTHKLLAAFSQASMIHVKGKIECGKFNEAFMMHTSTSPQYGIIASLDVATKMMEESGRYLLGEAIEEAIIFRKKMVDIKKEIHEEKGMKDSEKWWYEVWQPKAVEENEVKNLVENPKYWVLNESDNWHGFGKIEEDYIMLDPVKVSILTPGVKKNSSELEDWGMPASIVARFLRKKGIVVEKTGLYSFLVLFSIGITKGKSGSLISALHEFKKLYDREVLLEDVFPEIIDTLPQNDHDLMLSEFCLEMHHFYKNKKIIELTNDVYKKENIPNQILSPYETYQFLIKDEVELVDVDKNLENRVVAVMLVPYPPGIPIIMPGEKVNESILNYLMALSEFNEKYKDFEIEIHGLIAKKQNGGKKLKVYCIKKEIIEKKVEEKKINCDKGHSL